MLGGTPGGELFKGFSALGNRLIKDRGLDNLISSIKNFLPANKLLPMTRLMEVLMDLSSASNQSLQETDDYLFLDPRAPKNPNASLGIFSVGPGGAGGAANGRSKRMQWPSLRVWSLSWVVPDTSSTATSRSGLSEQARG